MGRRRRGGVRQPPSSRPSARPPAPQGGRSPCCLRSSARSCSSSLLQLDLLRTAGLDLQTSANLDPATHAKTLFSSALGEPGAREDALLTFRYGDRERLRPSTPKIHIYGAAALADRQHLAFDDRKTTPTVHQTRQIPSRLLWHIAGRSTGPILAVRATRSCEHGSAAQAGSPISVPTRAWPAASMGMDNWRRVGFAGGGRKRGHGAAIPIGNLLRGSQGASVRPREIMGCQRRLRRL